ncbi:ribonucleoside transporter [Klebsiella pneumoniae]|uniref:Ribonucleoside transporter n=1 Tax=Klebsiella pneumoniae TaxID=573 RepID=A0A377TH24_KLEPN|nr:ribonucleoside transporter [Klebsiella pneumoniae]
MLLSFGIASFIGTSLSSVLLKRSVKAALAIAPLVLTACAVALVLVGREQNHRLDGGDYLGLRVCADPGGGGQRGSPVPSPIRRKKPGRFRWR